MSHAIVAAAGGSVADTASGVGIPLALAAGLVSFLSPCVLPLVPGYLSTVAGVAPADLHRAGARRLLAPSLLFIAGFSVIFILLGLAATRVGATLHAHLGSLRLAGGIVIILLGIVFLATPFVRSLNFQWHPHGLLKAAGRGSPLAVGAAFAIAWTPCTSVTLGAILTQAAISNSAAHGAVLLACYSAGLAIPFLLIAFAFEHMTRALALLRRHFPLIVGVGGAVLIALGALIVSGEFTVLNSYVSQSGFTGV
jgi:cytochrome c-type biogenesis protein